MEEKLLTYQGDLNDRKSKAEVAKAELDLANSNYEKEKEVFDGMLVTYEQAAKGIETQTRSVFVYSFMAFSPLTESGRGYMTGESVHFWVLSGFFLVTPLLMLAWF